MATAIGGLQVFIEDDTGRFQSSMRQNAALVDAQARRMSQSLNGTAKSVDDLSRKASSFKPDAFRALAVSALRAETSVKRLELSVYAIGAALGGGFLGTSAALALTRYADEFTNIQNKIKAVTEGRVQQVAAEDRIFAIAQKTRSSIDATATSYQRLKNASPELAQDSEKLFRVIETVQKSFGVAGATTQEAQSSAIQLAQALGSGRLQGDELRSILENNIPLAKILADELSGGNVGALKSLGSEGLLTTEKVIDAILRGSDKIDAAFARTQPRIADGWVAANNALLVYLGRADKSLGASSALANGLVSLADNFDTVANAAVAAAGAATALFAGRAVGGFAERGIANARQAKEAIAERNKALAMEAEAASQSRRAAYIVAQNSAASVEDFDRKPTFEQADPRTQARRTKAASDADQAAARARQAFDREADLLVQRGNLADATAAKSNAALKGEETARKGVLRAEEQLAAAIQKRNTLQAAQASAGGDVKRSELSRFYNALGTEVEARSRLANAQAAQEVSKSNIAALKSAEVVAKSRKDFEFLQGVRTRIAEETGRLDDLAKERINAGNALRKAEAATAAESAAIEGRQGGEAAKAAARVAKANDDIAKSQTNLQKMREAEGLAAQRVADSVVQSETAKATKLAALDERIIAARQVRVKAQDAADQTAAALRNIDSSIPGNAAAQRDALKNQSIAASKAYGEALAIEQAAVAAAGAAAEAAAPKVGVLANAKLMATRVANGFTSAMGSLVGFLGGPIGAAFTGLALAVGAYEAMQLRATMRAQEFKDALEKIPGAIDRIDKARASGNGVPAGVAADTKALQGKTSAGFDEQISNLRFSVLNSINRKGTGLGLAEPLRRELAGAIDAAFPRDGTINAGKPLIDLVAILEKAGATSIDVANKVGPLLQLARAAVEAKGKIGDLNAAAGNLLQDPRDLQAQASKAFAQRSANAINAAVTLPTGDQDELMQSVGENDPTFKVIRMRGQLQRQAVAEEGDKTKVAIQAKFDEIMQQAQKDGVSFPVNEAMQLAQQIVTAQQFPALGASDATDKATASIKALQDAVALGLDNNFANQLTEAQTVLTQLTPAIQTSAAAVSSSMTLMASSLDSSNAEAAAKVRELQAEFERAAASGEITQSKVNDLVSALSALAGSNPNLAAIVASIMQVAGAAAAATNAVLRLRGAMAGAAASEGNMASQRRAQENADASQIDQDFSKFQAKRNSSINDIESTIKINKLRSAGNELGARRLELEKQYAGQNIPDDLIDSLAAEAGKKPKKGGAGKKSAEQKFTDKLDRLRETGEAAFFTAGDRELIAKLEEMKAKPELIKATNEAIKNGQPLPAEAAAVQQALELKKAGDAVGGILEKYGSLDQVLPVIAEKQRILNLAVAAGKITTEQAGLAMADYLEKFKATSWIGQVTDAFASLSNSMVDVALGTKKPLDALKDFATQLARIAVQVLITQPLVDSLRASLSNVVSNNGQGGGGLGSIFSSLLRGFTGGAGGGLGTTPGAGGLYHSGGLVGSSTSFRHLPMSTWASAPRHHMGLKSDEYAAILQRGERVLTSAQSARNNRLISGLAMSAATGGGGGGTRVVINNNNGSDVSTKSSRGPSGEEQIEVMVEQAFQRNMHRRGGIARALEGMGSKRI